MEEKKNLKPHSITWQERMQGRITGVKDVFSFDETSVVLETEQGRLTVKGKDLHISRLMLEQGEVEMEGRPESIQYSGSSPAEKGSLLRRLFR